MNTPGGLLIEISKTDIENISQLVADGIFRKMVTTSQGKNRDLNNQDDIVFLIAYAALGKLLDKITNGKKIPLEPKIVAEAFLEIFPASGALLNEVIRYQTKAPPIVGTGPKPL